MHLNLGKSLCLIGLLLASGGCVSQQPKPQTSPPDVLTIKQVQDRAQALQEQTVVLRGLYKGWWGKCQGGPPMSRSDWMVEDEKGACLYVHGPVPPGIESPPSRVSVGLPLKLQGTLKTGARGQIYLALPRNNN